MNIGKSGLILIAIFLLISLVANFLAPQKWPKIPGDILIEKPGLRVYIPWVSSIVLTILASFLLSSFIH